MRSHSIRCWKCHKFVRVEFDKGPRCPVGGASVLDEKDKTYYAGKCPRCQVVNIIRKPSWAKEDLRTASRMNKEEVLMVENHLRMGDLVKLKTNQEIGIIMATEEGKATVYWGNGGVCSEGPVEQLEAIRFSPQAQFTANFTELVDSFMSGRVWMMMGSPGRWA